MKNLSKDEMKMVIGGRFMAYSCKCIRGTGGEWFYLGGNAPSQGTVDHDVSNSYSSGTANCNYKAYEGEMPTLP